MVNAVLRHLILALYNAFYFFANYHLFVIMKHYLVWQISDN